MSILSSDDSQLQRFISIHIAAVFIGKPRGCARHYPPSSPLPFSRLFISFLLNLRTTTFISFHRRFMLSLCQGREVVKLDGKYVLPSKIEFVGERPTHNNVEQLFSLKPSHLMPFNLKSFSLKWFNCDSTQAIQLQLLEERIRQAMGIFDAVQYLLLRGIPPQLLPPVRILFFCSALQAAGIHQIPIVTQTVPPREDEDVLQLAHEEDEA